jgi:fructose-1,6-bisphosphatase II / sedoheptulose-1,7-bisphosphatase
VKRRKTSITTESVVMRASTGTVRWVKGEHRHEPGLRG